MKTFKTIQIAFITLLIALVLSGCPQRVDPVTDPNTAQLPVITINGFEDGGSIEKNNQTSQATINADYGMGITISGSAKNPDGVENFSIEIVRNNKTLFKAMVNGGSPDSKGKVLDLLQILGTNNNGGMGNTPMKFIMDEVTEVKVSAKNYAGATNEFSLLYVPVAASQRGKDIIETITLQKDFTLNIFSATIPNLKANGTLVALNGGPFDVYLLKPSGNNPFNCNDASSIIMLQALGNLYPIDYVNLFGKANPPLPITLKACAAGPSANSDHVNLKMTYRLN